MYVQRNFQRRTLIILTVVVLASLFLASCSSPGTATVAKTPVPTHTPTPTPSPTPNPTPTPDPTPTYPPLVSPSQVLGVVADTQTPFKGIPWVRVSYATCVGTTKGAALKNTIAQFHSQGVRVMLSLCQWATDLRLYDMSIINDAAQGGADAVQCGNEQMKAGQYNRYVPPAIFAKFFDLCGQAMHACAPVFRSLLVPRFTCGRH